LNIKDFSFSEFNRDISERLSNYDVAHVCFEGIINTPLIKGKQCLYIMDWKTSTITFSKGVMDMLGYTNEEFTMDLVLNYFHPDDLKFVKRIIKGTVEHSIQNNTSGEWPFLNITFRLRKKDGTYLKVLRKSSSYEIDNQGRLLSNFSMLTDISFISNNNKVEWDIYTENIDNEKFKKDVFKEFQDFFTPRELQIIKLINKGFSSSQIASKLFVSSHTITSHRKNILKKSNCHNVQELVAFCQKNGII
jgi:DNA-binding CsgD family transcriptional regulator